MTAPSVCHATETRGRRFVQVWLADIELPNTGCGYQCRYTFHLLSGNNGAILGSQVHKPLESEPASACRLAVAMHVTHGVPMSGLDQYAVDHTPLYKYTTAYALPLVGARSAVGSG